MLIDLNSKPPAPPVSDICVIGGGIAGLLLALKLADAGKSVTLLEAGGMHLEPESQALFDAEMARDRHAGTYEGRFRAFGGSSIRWGGQCLPFPTDIFQPEPGTFSAGWPIADSEIMPYYPELQRLLQTDLLPFDATLLPALTRPSVPFSSDFVLRFSKWIPFPYRNLGETIGKRLLTHPRVMVYSHSNAVAIETDGERVTGVRVRNYVGREFQFKARTVLLCAGTVESSRLLLCSPSVPNAHGQIGRGFHDHLSVPVAAYTTATARRTILRTLGPFFSGGTMHTFKLEAASQLRSRENLLNVMAHAAISEPAGSGTAALRTTLSSWQRSGISGLLQTDLRALARGAFTALRLLLWARLAGRRAVSPEASIDLRIDVEQPARPECRITLSDKADALGMPRAVVHWTVGEQERRTVLTFAGQLRQELERIGLSPDQWHDLSTLNLTDTYHPMGGLRMSTSAQTGVVGTDLKVHGLANLYVAGCSVFPSGGSSNPTFTAMALALRLANHLTRAS